MRAAKQVSLAAVSAFCVIVWMACLVLAAGVFILATLIEDASHGL